MSKRASRTLLASYLPFLMFLGIFSVSSCKSLKKTTQAGGEVYRPGDCRNTQALLDSMKSHQFHFETLSSKLDCDAKGDSMKGSFDVTLRIRKDSVIWMNVSALGGLYKVARILITQDSVFFINYHSNREDGKGTYFREDFNHLNKELQADFDFDMLQNILIGNSVTFYEEKEKLRSYGEDGKCVLSTIRKRKLKRVERRHAQLAKTDSAQTIWMDPATQKIARILFNDFNTKRSFDATYSDFTKASNGLMVPNKAKFMIKAEKRLFLLEMMYKKINLNHPLDFPFVIPEDYIRIYFKDPSAPDR
jgi:hypothetical protein